MQDLIYILLNAPSAPVDGVSDLSVAEVANGLERQGGWYLAAVMLFVMIWAVRRMLSLTKEHTAEQKKQTDECAKEIKEQAALHHAQEKEQTEKFFAYLDRRDSEVKELLVASTETSVEVGNTLRILNSSIVALAQEVRHEGNGSN